MARDLGSSNGTAVQLPDRDVEQLRSGEDYLLEPGALVIVADTIRFTFETRSTAESQAQAQAEAEARP